MIGISRFFVHTGVVETFIGANSVGDVYAAPVTLEPPNGCFVEDEQKLLHDKGGDEQLSQTQVYTFVENAHYFTPGSKFTFDGKTARVITASTKDAPGLRVPSHLAVSLT